MDDDQPTDDQPERDQSDDELTDEQIAEELERRRHRLYSGLPVNTYLPGIATEDLHRLARLCRLYISPKSPHLSMWLHTYIYRHLQDRGSQREDDDKDDDKPRTPPVTPRETENPELPVTWDNAEMADALMACHCANWEMAEVSHEAAKFLDAVEMALLTIVAICLKRLDKADD